MDETFPFSFSGPPQLDIFSTSFNPEWFLNNRVNLPYPKAKEYNNIAEYYTRTFLLKNITSKKPEKDRPYDRDFSFYYATLGMNEYAQRRYEQRKYQRNAYKMKTLTGYRRAKMRKYFVDDDDPDREPVRSIPPLQSTKIVQIETPLTKYKLIPRNIAPQETADNNKVTDSTNDICEVILEDSPKPVNLEHEHTESEREKTEANL